MIANIDISYNIPKLNSKKIKFQKNFSKKILGCFHHIIVKRRHPHPLFNEHDTPYKQMDNPLKIKMLQLCYL